jgi:hypothetical protein
VIQLNPMKIKPPSAAHRRKSRLRRLTTHWWLVPEQPKSKGRLGQLNKANTKAKVKSEFIDMCWMKEAARNGAGR